MISPNSFLERYCSLTNQSSNFLYEQVTTLSSEVFEISEGKVFFTDLAGLRNAVNVINRAQKFDSTQGTGVFKPSFQYRGVIEGFYGIPWSHEQRKRGLVQFAKWNMNTFILAPKDDPWQRFDWKTPFSSDFINQTRDLLLHANELLIDLSVCVSPGLTVSYSSAEDLDALMYRYNQLNEIGVMRFGLLLDDIPGELQFETDQKKYLSIAEAHADFANRINEKLKRVNPEASIFVCPLQYHGRGHEPYISLLGNSLDSDIDLMWTGRQICSEYLEVQDAIVFQESTSKSALYWDNYPVNDVAMVHQLHIGPIQKRDKELGNHSIGLVANPMDRFESSLLPLATIADYLWDSNSYEAEASWERALKELIPIDQDRIALRHLFRNCFESCLAVDAAPDFGAILGSATFSWRTGQASSAAKVLESYASEALRSFEVITAEAFSWRAIYPEISPWLSKYKMVAEALLEIASILRSTTFTNGRLKGSADAAEQVKQIRISLAQNPTRIFGDGLDLVLGELATVLSAA